MFRVMGLLLLLFMMLGSSHSSVLILGTELEERSGDDGSCPSGIGDMGGWLIWLCVSCVRP